MISAGHNPYDIKQTYSVDQVYLYYEKCKKSEMENRFFSALIAGQAAVYGSPAYDQSGANKKSQHWKKFIDSFDWEKVLEKRKKTKEASRNPIGMFQAAGIPILNFSVRGEK